jgi:hypothetical protein
VLTQRAKNPLKHSICRPGRELALSPANGTHLPHPTFNGFSLGSRRLAMVCETVATQREMCARSNARIKAHG